MSKKTVKCAQCGKILTVRSFRLLPYKRTDKGIVCKACLKAKPQAEAPDTTAEV